MTGMCPVLETIDGIRQPRGGFCQVRGINLLHIAEADNLGAWSCSRDERLHLLGRDVLCFINDQKSIEECSASHEVQRPYFDLGR